MDDAPRTRLLVVLCGRPGSGKTTLARRLCTALGAAHLRIDAIETALLRLDPGRPIFAEGYAVAAELARGDVANGVPVVVDAVNPVPESRAWWRELATETGARLVVLETVVDAAVRRARVESRTPDLAGQRVPTWAEAEASDWVDWDAARDGERTRIDTTDAAAALAAALGAVGRP